MTTATVTHNTGCPTLTSGGSASGPCLCTPGRPFATRPVPTRFTLLPIVKFGDHRSRVSAERGLAAANARDTAASLMSARGVSWDVVREWGRQHGVDPDHTKPSRPSMRCVRAYLAANPATPEEN